MNTVIQKNRANTCQSGKLLASVTGALLLVLGGLASTAHAQTTIICGQTVTHTTTVVQQNDQYTYFGTDGEVLSIALWGPISCNSDYMVADIYLPSGDLLTTLRSGCNVGAAVQLILTNTGTYTLLVHESLYRATGSYSLTIQSLKGGGCNGKSISCGQTVVTNTAFYTQMDTYSFAGTAGQSLAIALWGPISCNSDYMVVDIYGPTGQFVTSLASGCNVGAALGLTLTNTGIFTLVVHESFYRATSGYQLSIQSVIGGGCNGKPITCGNTVATNTTFYTQMDTYSFAGTAGQSLAIALWGPIGCNSDYMVVDIYKPSGELLTSLASGCNVGAALRLTLTNNGTYTLVVHESYYRATSGYQLSIQSLKSGGCNGMPITCGKTVATNTTFYAQMDTYSFAGTAGQRLAIALWGPIGCNSDYMVVDIYNPSGELVSSLASGCNVGAALGLTLTNNGIFTLVVHESYYRATSGYQLNIQTVTGGGCNGKAITCGETITANTDFYTQMDTYSFAGTAGQALALALWGPVSCNSDYMQADIYSPSGEYLTTLASPCNSGGALYLALTNTGVYTLMVHESYFRAVAGYALTLQSAMGGGCNPRRMLCGQAVNGTIRETSETLGYQLMGTAGEHVILSASGFGGMVTDLYGPAGAYLASVSPGGSLNMTFTNTGAYTLLVHAANYGGTGGFGLSLTVFGGCATLYPGNGVGRTGEVVCLPLNLASSAPAVWVSFNVHSNSLLSNPSLAAAPQFTNATIKPGSNSNWVVTMQASPANGAMGNIGSLCFTPLAVHSGRVPIELDSLVVTNQGGSIPGADAFGNRFVVIANEPLLEAQVSTNQQRTLNLYGKANTNYRISYKTNLAAAAWTPILTNVVPASLSHTQSLTGVLSNAPVVFLRATEQ